MSKPIKIAQFGLGPIGQSCVRLLAEKSRFRLVGAVDINPDLVGRGVNEACGLGKEDLGRVFASFEELWTEEQPDAVLHTAGSRVGVTFDQCFPMVTKGVAVVSSCEELLFPAHRAPEQTQEFDALCREHGGRILGTGVNPGFVLDVLPVALAMVAATIRGVHGRRVVDASLRREPLQRKIGSGLPPAEFLKLWESGKAGHAGFQESILLLAHALDWKLLDVTETLEPVVAEKKITTPYFQVEPGQTRGLHQIVKGVSTEGYPIELDLTMALDEPEPHDAIRLDSDPALNLTLPGGVFGDKATVASLVNAVPRLLASAPGVRLMTELPLAAP